MDRPKPTAETSGGEDPVGNRPGDQSGRARSGGDRSGGERCPQCDHEVGDAWLVCAWCGRRLAAPAELAEGDRLSDGRYQILRVIGRGGFAITYDAGDRRLQRRVAVKELFPESAVRHGSLVLTPPQGRAGFRASRERFLREARVLARFTHPGIVRVYEVFEEHGTAYLVMELLHGRTLIQLLQQRNRPFGEADVLDVAGRVAAALRPVHAAGVLHRDVNPSNVMMSDHGRIVVIDFGLARDYDASLTVGMTRVVTPGYAPLEQYRGEGRFGPSTDVYGLAATCYRLATGKVPTSAIERDAGAVLASARSINPAISKAVSDAIGDGLELESTHRPQDLDAFLARLGVSRLPDGPRSILLDTIPPASAGDHAGGAHFAPPSQPPSPPVPRLDRPDLETRHGPGGAPAPQGGGVDPEPVTGATEIVRPPPVDRSGVAAAGLAAAGPVVAPDHAAAATATAAPGLGAEGLAAGDGAGGLSATSEGSSRAGGAELEPATGETEIVERPPVGQSAAALAPVHPTAQMGPSSTTARDVDATRHDPSTSDSGSGDPGADRTQGPDATWSGASPRRGAAAAAPRPEHDGGRTAVARPLLARFVPSPQPPSPSPLRPSSAPERIVGGPAAPRVPGVVGPHRPGRRKLLLPLTAVALATASAAPVLVMTVLVVVVLPLIATLGDSLAHRLRAEHGVAGRWAERRMAPGPLAPARFVRNVVVSIVRATPMIGVGAVLLAGWYGLDRLTDAGEVLDLTLRAIGLLVVGVTVATARDGSGRFRTGLGLDHLVARWVPEGRTTERLVVLWMVATFVVAGAVWLTPDPFPLP